MYARSAMKIPIDTHDIKEGGCIPQPAKGYNLQSKMRMISELISPANPLKNSCINPLCVCIRNAIHLYILELTSKSV